MPAWGLHLVKISDLRMLAVVVARCAAVALQSLKIGWIHNQAFSRSTRIGQDCYSEIRPSDLAEAFCQRPLDQPGMVMPGGADFRLKELSR
jgi:hypothetical protein